MSMTLISCSFSDLNDDYTNTDQNEKKEYAVTIHYYDGITRSYTVYNRGNVNAEILAPSGYVIEGLYDESGVQYTMNDCIVENWSSSIPTTLYAKYKKIEKSSYTLSYIGLDEDPEKISFYKTKKVTWTLNSGDKNESEIINICKCNPYADLTITATFMGKGINSQKYTQNTFKYYLIVNDETIASFKSENLGNDYTKYTVSGTIKAKQLMNSNYEIMFSVSSALGYEDYTVKNLTITFSFDFQ